MKPKTLFILLVLGGVLILVNQTFYIVNQYEQAVVLQFGKPVAIERTPGLKVKTPFVQNVEFFDKRLLDFNAEPKEVIASDQKRLIVDAYLRYRIIDPLRFYQAVRDERTMTSRLNSILESSLRQVLGNATLAVIVSEKREQIMQDVRTIVNSQAMGKRGMAIPKEGDEIVSDAEGTSEEASNLEGFGVEVVDVRIMRADLPKENSQAIFLRMQTEREREAKEFRAMGAEEAQKIRSTAEKERTILIAEAKKKSEILRGEGEAISTKTFAEAFGRDEEFFDFYRSMQAYKEVLTEKDTTMIMSPKSEFLHHLGQK